MGDTPSWRWLQRVAGAGLLWLAFGSVRRSWDAIVPVLDGIAIVWTPVAIGAAAVLGGALLFLFSWRVLVDGWPVTLRLGGAAALWARANLLGYLPAGGLPATRLITSAMAGGVPEKWAASVAVVPVLVRLAAAAIIGLLLVGLGRLGVIPVFAIGAFLGGAVTLAGTVALASPILPRQIAWLIRRPESVRAAEPEALGPSLLLALAGWSVIGIGVAEAAAGLFPGIELPWPLMIGALCAATVAGYTFLFLPTGFLVREGILFVLLKGELGAGRAFAVAVLARVLVTGVELVLALPFLSSRSAPR